jgi:xanthine/CO dehydrogenase XdhC/CoxF family maturation factor
MIVHADGRFEGSVSGGCVESDIMAAAADVIAGLLRRAPPDVTGRAPRRAARRVG